MNPDAIARVAVMLAATASGVLAAPPPRNGHSLPAEVSYSIGSSVHVGDNRTGTLDSLHLHLGYVESLRATDQFDWLVGIDWRRFQFGVSGDIPVPNTLQSAAAVVGFDWRFRDGWHARIEVLPGAYGDFSDAQPGNFNAPFTLEVSRSVGENLVLGAQLLVDARRDTPVLPAGGVTWRFADRWELSVWIPRPQVEYHATPSLTFLAGASFVGGTYQVASDLGRHHGQSDLEGQLVEYREVRVGGGFRFVLLSRFNAEISGGWTIDRRFDFHRRHLLVNGDGAPYVQASFGANF